MTSTQRANRGPAAGPENRAAIIRAASEVFTAQGLDAPLNAIAKRAGVGQGSLYRHFPTRESLAFAAFESNVDDIERRVAEGGTLADVLRMVTEQAAGSVAFIQLIVRHPEDPRGIGLESRVRAVVGATIDAGRASGTVPAGFSTDDVMIAIALVAGGLGATLPAGAPTVTARAWQLMGIQLG